MKINFMFLLILSILFLHGCATTRNMKLTAIASPDQKTDSYGAVVSEKMHMVSISPYKELSYMNDNAIFNVIVENGGEEPITIGTENISMIFEGHDKKRTVKKLDVLSEKIFMQDVEHIYMKKIVSYLDRSLRENWDNQLAPIQESETNSRVSRFRDSSSHPLVKRMRATNRSIKILKEILPDLILGQKTIMPRESISVLISCRTNEIPRRIKGDLKIKVSIDGEEHGFTFARR